MKRLLPTIGAALLAISLVVQADPQDELYATYYGMIQDADALLVKGEESAALIRYREVQDGLQKLRSAYPAYNTTVIQYRLEYVNQKIAPLAAKYPNIKATPKPATTTPALKTMPAKENVPAPVPQPSFSDSEITRLHDQLISLQTEKIMLQKQLKDALAAKPASVDPKELAKAEAAMGELQKERDLLKVSLQQEQAKSAKLVDPKEVTETRAQLAEANKELAGQKKAMTKLTDENASLEKRISSMRESKELPQLKEEVSTLKKQLADANKLAGNAAKLESANKSLEAQIASARQENESLKAASKKMGDIATLEAENRALAAEATKFRAENTTLKETAKKAGDVAKLESELKTVRAENESLKASAKKMGDVTKLERENQSLTAEATRLREQNDVLSGQLKDEQKRAANMAKASNADEGLKKELSEAQKRLAEQQRATAAAVSAQAQLKAQADEAARLRKENAKLEALLTDPNAAVAPAAAPAMSSRDTVRLEAKVRDLEKERDELEKKLKDASSRSNRRDTDKAADQLATLKAQLEALEAKKVPYTQEELALFKAPSSTPTALVAAVESKPNTPAVSASTRTLLADAQKAFGEKRFDAAAEKYEQALKQDENNPYILANLAGIQMEQNKLRDAEKNLDKALAIKKDDAFSLSLKGIVKFRQEKYDDALELLSRSAQLDPNSSETQNYLGITLSQKGQRGAAEAALRKSIQIAPGNANAHHNLAVVYATQNPPMTELARWHYQKARGYGHPVNADLEKLLAK